MATPNMGNQAAMMKASSELMHRILFVLGALIIYRLGTHIPLPGIDAQALAIYQATLQEGPSGLLNMFSGGALSRMALFTLSVMPYITASIIIQLMTAVSPSLAELKKEGEVGQRRINQYIRYLTVVIAFVQGFGLAAGVLEGQTVTIGADVRQLVLDPGMAFRIESALTLMTGTLFLMWLGEQITQRGVGNGISVIIFAGIVAELPAAVYQTFEQARMGELAGHLVIAIIALVTITTTAVVWMEMAQRRVPVQYPKRQTQQNMAAMQQGSHIPFKVNMSGVMPAIFGSSLLVALGFLTQSFSEASWAQEVGAWLAPGRPAYILIYVVLIVFFCFFWVATVFNTEEQADNLKKQGGFVPGVRPGAATATYFDYVLARITTIGAIYMSLICILPQIIINEFSISATAAYLMGGTSLLIIVSVTIDVVSRIQSYIIAQRYESLLKKSRFRKGGMPR